MLSEGSAASLMAVLGLLGIRHLRIAMRLVRPGVHESLLMLATASFQPLTIFNDGDWREIYAHVSR
jgi:hypothetical protein